MHFVFLVSEVKDFHSTPAQQCDVKYGPKTLDEYIDGMTKAIKENLSSINKAGKESNLY